MDKAVAQAMPVASAIVIAIHREAGDQWMVNRIAIVAVVTAALLLAVNLDGKAVDVDGGSHHGVISTPTRTAQVAVRPIKETEAKRLAVFRRSQPID